MLKLWMSSALPYLGIMLVAATFAAAAESEHIGLFTAMDLGRIENGLDLNDEPHYDPSGKFLLRYYVNFEYTKQLDERNLISTGVGGVFWKAYERGGGGAADKTIKFGPGISHAFFTHDFTKSLGLTFGYMPYKYNAAAKNLGEYLFRTEAYPVIVYTGGWSWMNSANYPTVGAKLSWDLANGKFLQDFVVFVEYFNSPIYDITPAYIGKFKPAEAFTLGGAVSLHRFFTPTPDTKDQLTKKRAYQKDLPLPDKDNEMILRVQNGDPGLGTPTSHAHQWAFGAALDTMAVKTELYNENPFAWQLSGVNSPQEIILNADLATFEKGQPARQWSGLHEDLATQAPDVYTDSSFLAAGPPDSVSFDLSALKLLGFFNLDLAALLDLDAGGLGAFGLYGEFALLGIKNYPIFYTDYKQRFISMLGLNVPTFGLLDYLSLEVEYLDNPIVESTRGTFDDLNPIPDRNFRYDVVTRDDWKWSVQGHRRINSAVSVFFLVANDHFRPKDGFANPTYIPVTNRPGHWYWLTRLQWAI